MPFDRELLEMGPADAAGAADAPPRPYSGEWYHQLSRRLGPVACRQIGLFGVPDSFTLSVVVPVFNEEKTLELILDKVRQVPIRKQIVLVDDGSRDGSPQLMRAAEAASKDDPDNAVLAVFQDRNRGKGAALRRGLAEATGDVVVIQDADLEYDPADYPRLLEPIVDGRADVVYGSRFRGDRATRVLDFWHYRGNQVLTLASNCFTNMNLTDMETCYKVMKREVVESVLPTLKQDRFGFEPEVTAKIARRNYRVYEVAISYAGRGYAEGKKIGWKDGVKALWCIMRYGFGD